MKNNLVKRLLSFILSFAIVFGMMPSTAFTAFASGGDTVYISVSYDGVYTNGTDGKPISYVPVKINELKQIDLDEYGLGSYKYDADSDGSYETTVLHLYVYTHTILCGKDWSEVSVSGGPGSIFFASGIFGFSDCNLNYYVNGEYPLQSEGWGATADICVLKPGDFVDVAGFTSWGFFSDSNAGFKYFTDENGNISHSFTAKQNEEFSVKLVKTSQDMNSGSGTVKNPHSADVYYSQTKFDSNAQRVTTDSDGKADITFAEAGTWYIWSNGEYGLDADPLNIVNSPAYATVTVEQGEQPAVIAVESVTLDTETAELEVDDTTTLTATVLPENATDKTVTWESSDPAVATVADGVVTAVAAGTATITATSGGKTAECTVIVKAKSIAVESVTLDKEAAELEVGNTVELTATVLPENATDKTVTWESSAPTVATVADGVVTAVAAGTATITAASGGKTAECTVTVTQPQAAEPTVLYVSPGRNTQNWPQTNQYYVAKVTVEGATVDYQETSGSDYHVYFNASTEKDAQITINVEAGGSKPERLGINFNDDATNTKTYTANLVDGEATVKIYAYKASGAGASRSGTKTFHFHTATVNNAPALAQGVVSPDEKTITAGENLELDLSQIFTDADGDTLAYTVSVDGAAATATEAAYSYSNTVAGTYELVFTATDGKTNESKIPEYKLSVVVENSTVTYEVTVNMPAEVTPVFYANAGYNSDGTATNGAELTATANNGTYKVSVPENVTAVNIVAGSNSLSVNTSETKEYTLRKVSLTGVDMLESTVEMTSAVKDSSNHAVTGENNVYLVSTGEEHTFTAIPADTTKYKNTDTKLAVEAGSDTLNLKLNVTLKNLIKVTAPKGSTVSAGSFGGYFVYSFVEEFHKTETEDTVTYYFIAPTGSGQKFYRVQHAEGVTYWNYISSSEADVTVTKDDLYIGSTEFNKKTVYSNFEKNVYDLADIYLNINSKGYMNLAKGETFELNVFRNWFAIESFINSKVATPDFNYEIINLEGENVVSVEKNDKNSAVATLTANNEGTAIVLVTYDAMTHMQGQSSGSSKQFSAIWPERTGVFVVSVDKDGTAIVSNMTSNGAAFDAEHSPVFYLGDEGASVSFKPEDGCTVTVARPTLTANSLNYSTGFVSTGVDVAEDGTVTVSGLVSGRNIIKLEKDGVASYQVVTARKVSYTMTDASGNPVTEESVIRPGDTLKIRFTGLTSPAEKLSGVYNFNFSLSYTDENGNNFKSNAGSGYGVYDFSGNPARQLITITVPEDCTEGIYTLNGFIQIGGFAAAPIGGHRDVRYATGKPQSFNAESAGMQLGTLPELKITLIENLRTEAKAEIAAYKNTDELSESKKAQVADIIAAANTEIENATTAHQVENSVNDAKQQLDAIRGYAKLNGLVIHSSTNPSDANVYLKNSTDTYTTTNVFNPDTTSYTLTTSLTDATTQMRFRASAAYEGDKVTLYYDGGSKDITWTSGTSKYANFLKGGKNTFTIVVSGEGAESTTYTFDVYVTPTLSSLATDAGYWDKTFKTATKEYTVTIAETVQELVFAATSKTADSTITYNGSENNVVDVTNIDKVEVVVSKDGVANTYIVNLEKQPTNTVKFNVTPKDANIMVYDHTGVVVKPNTDGSFNGMFDTYKYTYTVVKNGYVSQQGTIPATGGVIGAELVKVTGEQPQEVEAYWPNFRGNDTNMAITDSRTPQNEDVEKISPKWIKKLGTGWSANPSVQIIADDALIVMSVNKTIFKMDLDTGEVLAQATMAAAPNFGYTPPTYAAGMIFCPLSGGMVQAFNADTLESVWIYKDKLGGQSLSPITYSDGYIYTGFWNGESKNANYVCIPVTDEDPTQTDEEKLAAWKHTQLGGFYWAGSVVVGNAVIVGTDDGQAEGANGSSQVYSFNKYTGEVISCIELTGMGDQRSSMAYDVQSGRVYFTTKGGYLCRADVDAQTGELSNFKAVDNKAMSTSTPVVYKGRVYYATGSGISATGSSGNIVVADAETMEMLFAVGLKGYPQCSLLLSTAYEAQTGCVYLYSTYNNNPGGISVVKVKTDCTTAEDAQLTELYGAEGYEQYCIASIICDENGTLFYKNDSGNIFAIGIPSAANVEKLINDIGEVTLEDKGAIAAAREAYDALSEEDKVKVSNYETLTKAEADYAALVLAADQQAAEEVDKLINNIGEIKLENYSKIEKARNAYDKLTAEQKKLVGNYNKLLEAETEAVNQVEDLIDEIGEVDIDSADAIADAKKAYNYLPEYLQKKVDNYDDLKAAEKELKKLREEALALLSEGKLVLSKSELLELVDEFEKIDENTSYDAVLALMRTYSRLGEKQQLALKDTDALNLAQKIIAAYNHEDASTGIRTEDLEWNIRLVIEDVEDDTVAKSIESALENSTVLQHWDIYLEDVITGERYIADKTICIKVPAELLGDWKVYDELCVVHYTDDGEIEVLNCSTEDEYVVFNAAEFSVYAMVGIMNEDVQTENIPAIVAPNGNTTGTEANSGWLIWVIIAAVGVAALMGIIVLKKRTADEE